MYMYNIYDSHEHKNRNMIDCECVMLNRLEKSEEIMRTEKADKQTNKQTGIL